MPNSLKGLGLADVLGKERRHDKAQPANGANERTCAPGRPANTGEQDNLDERKGQDEVGNQDQSHAAGRTGWRCAVFRGKFLEILFEQQPYQI